MNKNRTNFSKDDLTELISTAKQRRETFKDVFTSQSNPKLIKSDFTIDTNYLTPWTNEESQTLLSAAILEAETAKLISYQTGCKYIEQIKYLATDAQFQAYQHGWHPLGVTTPTVRNVSVSKIMVQEELYPEDLNNYSFQLSMMPGFNTELPFEQLYGELKSKEIAKGIELMIWGTQTGATDSTAYCTGLGYKIPADQGALTGTTKVFWNFSGLTTMTATDWINLISNMQNALPEEIQGMTDLTLFMGHSKFRELVKALLIANLYHVDPTGNKGYNKFTFPGTNIMVTPVNGLNSQNYICLTPAFNLVLLTDLMNEEDKFTLVWNPYDLKGQFYTYFKMGIDYYFPNYIVYTANS